MGHMAYVRARHSLTWCRRRGFDPIRGGFWHHRKWSLSRGHALGAIRVVGQAMSNFSPLEPSPRPAFTRREIHAYGVPSSQRATDGMRRTRSPSRGASSSWKYQGLTWGSRRTPWVLIGLAAPPCDSSDPRCSTTASLCVDRGPGKRNRVIGNHCPQHVDEIGRRLELRRRRSGQPQACSIERSAVVRPRPPRLARRPSRGSPSRREEEELHDRIAVQRAGDDRRDQQERGRRTGARVDRGVGQPEHPPRGKLPLPWLRRARSACFHRTCLARRGCALPRGSRSAHRPARTTSRCRKRSRTRP
jgi:hypothetical protein